MKILLAALIFLTAYFNVYSQKINYYTDFETGLKKAKQNNKPIFVTIGTPDFTNNTANPPRFTSGIDDESVAAFYNKKFVNVKISVADSAYANFRKLFPAAINSYPAYLFFDNEGNLLYKGFSVITSIPQKYMDMGNEALTSASSTKTIAYYEKLRKKGKINQADLKNYIILKQSLGLYNNALLIDEYVNYSTVQSFDDYNEVLFILKAGPLAYGKTYSLCYRNKRLVDSIYKYEPLALRHQINRNIINNTRAEAIRTKNAAMAMQLSNFTRAINTSNYQAASQSSAYEMLNFYSQIKDTANYFMQANYYYDNYYMRLTPDSIKRMRERSIEAGRLASLQSVKQMNTNTSPLQSKLDTSKLTYKKTNSFVVAGPPISNVPSILNNAAYSFYNFGTRNPNHLTKALLWCKRAIALSPDIHAYYDTMAHILYRLDFYDEALNNQSKAIELAKKDSRAQSSYIKSLETELTKMQQHTL
jgi:hypothetical protein